MKITSASTTIDAKEARLSFAELLNRVANHKERVVITRRDKEVAVLVPIKDLLLLEASQSKSDLEEAVLALKEARDHAYQNCISLDELKIEIGYLP